MTKPAGERSENERYEAARRLSALTPPGLFEAAREALADPEWRIRRAAWEALLAAQAGEDERFSFLLTCLEDRDNAGTRGAALEALIHLGAAAIPRLTKSLDSRDDRGKRYILDVLAQIRSPLAAPAARRLVEYPEENVGFAAAEVLGVSGSADDALYLLAALPSVAGTRRFAMLSAAVQIARRQTMQVSTAAVAPWLGDTLLRAPAVELLGAAGSEGTAAAIWALVAAGKPIDRILLALVNLLRRGQSVTLADDDYDRFAVVAARCRASGVPAEVRRAAFELFLHCSPNNVGPLLPILAQSDAEWLVEALAGAPESRLREWLPLVMVAEQGRAVAARLFAQRPELQGEAALLALLNQPGSHRSDALAALAAVGTLRAVPHLIAMCGDEEPEPADRAAEALVTLVRRGVAGLDEMVLNAMASSRADVRMRLLPTLGLLTAASEPAREQLLLAVRDPDPRVRKAASAAAADAPKDCAAVQALLARLADEDEEVRASAASSVAALGLPEAAPALEVLLDDPSAWVQSTALASLARLGAIPDTDRIAKLLLRGGVVGVAAAHVLGEQPRAGTVEVLALLLPQLDDDAAAELLKALAEQPGELPREVFAPLAAHPAWNVRAAAAHYLQHKRPAWAAEIARGWLAGESDDLVKLRLEELVGTAR